MKTIVLKISLERFFEIDYELPDLTLCIQKKRVSNQNSEINFIFIVSLLF
jgi:hypothetical protein